MLAYAKHRQYFWGIGILFILLIIYARLYLNVWLTNYVNTTLDNIPGYQGSIQKLDIHLYRGAYTIHQLKVRKVRGGVPVPFIEIGKTDLSIQWSALLHGRIVSDVHLLNPTLNFAVGTAGGNVQTGEEINWMQPVKDLMPIDINLVTIEKGRLSYRDFSAAPQVNIYINDMHGEARNLQNVEDKEVKLPSSLDLQGNSIGGGRMHIKGKLNVLKRIPDMDMNIALENVKLPALNDYAKNYAMLDFASGKISIYSEVVVTDGRLSGYIKPIATEIKVVDLRQDDGPLEILWETIAATFIQLFKNQPRDQFATKVALAGNLENIDANSWSAISGIFRNAFIEAFRKGFDEEMELTRGSR